jgi:hypothetical protein
MAERENMTTEEIEVLKQILIELKEIKSHSRSRKCSHSINLTCPFFPQEYIDQTSNNRKKKRDSEETQNNENLG